MPVPFTSEYGRGRACTRCGFKAFYYALLPLSLHWSMISYINSSFLEKYFTAQMVSSLFITASLVTLISFLHAGVLLNRFGAIKMIYGLTAIEIGALLGMAFIPHFLIVLFCFIAHVAVVPLIVFSLDVIMEELIGNQEDSTGSRRGLYLTISAFMGACSALLMGYLVGGGTPNFSLAYVVAALLVLPFIIIIFRNFRDFEDPHYPHLKVIQNIDIFWHRKDIRNAFFSFLLLQIFYVWTVVYIPLYLATEIGYNWEQIGLILFVGLMAYVIFEYPIGVLADKQFGEKEMMAFGFLILGVSISWFIFLDNSSIVAWMIVMFMTRVGASFVEATTESYFFKHTKSRDVATIGIYRVAQPLGFIIGPAIGGTLLIFLPFELLFVAAGLIMVPGMFFAMALKDTK